ncbi:hypothetical protein [Methylobacterium sp. SI9]|uniref:hypothetical protein n=1 Tax=Methylobacterium guangdongense TaxID=3138811 RepID=UPI00313D527F
MWLADSVAITILDYGRGNTVLIEIETPVGRLQAVGELEQIGQTLYFRRAHIQGLHRGALGRVGLNAIGAAILREAEVDAIVIEGGARTTGAGPKRGRRPPPFRYPR